MPRRARQTESSQTVGMEFHLIRIMLRGQWFLRINQDFPLPERRSREVKRGSIGNPGKHIAGKEWTGL